MARKEIKVGEGQRLKTSLQWLIALAALSSSWQALADWSALNMTKGVTAI